MHFEPPNLSSIDINYSLLFLLLYLRLKILISLLSLSLRRPCIFRAHWQQRLCGFFYQSLLCAHDRSSNRSVHDTDHGFHRFFTKFILSNYLFARKQLFVKLVTRLDRWFSTRTAPVPDFRVSFPCRPLCQSVPVSAVMKMYTFRASEIVNRLGCKLCCLNIIGVENLVSIIVWVDIIIWNRHPLLFWRSAVGLVDLFFCR